MLRKNTLALALAAALAAAAFPALAAEDVNQAYIKGLASYIGADDDRNVDDEIAGGVFGFGYSLSENFNVEFDFQKLDLSGDSGFPDQDQTALNLNLMNVYNRGGFIAPYILLGAGVVNTDVPGSEDQDDLQAQGGIGALWRLWGSRLSLRTEALYRWQDASSSLNDVLVNAGLSFALGSKAEPPAPAPVAAPAPVVAAPTDTDGDGVNDDADQCPGTPAGAAVDAQGCELDSDGDGVVDRLDECAGTPEGATVNARGCEQSLILRGVTFENDSAKLTPQSRQILDSVAEILKKRPNFRNIEVRGHTDSNGSEAYNQRLSERRAVAVKDYLVEAGIDSAILTAKGFGESEPLQPNDTADGRAANRRVALEFGE